MAKWVYKTGIVGSNELYAPETAGKRISGRLYRDGVEYRPSGNNATDEPDPTKKEFRHDKSLGKIYFANVFDEDEKIDIPYEEENFL